MLQGKGGPRKRYCGIQSCINFKGGTSTEQKFFRPPVDKYTHDKWKEAIGEQQNIRHISLICELHFEPDDIISYGCRKGKLKSGAIPTIFVGNHKANLNTVKIESIDPISGIESTSYDEKNFVNANGTNSTTCQKCIDQKSEMPEQQRINNELNRKLTLQTRLTEYWKAIALKYEPEQDDPKWSIDPIEVVTADVLDVIPRSPPPETVFKPYQCGTCNECFELPRTLEQHLQLKHFAQVNPQLEYAIQICVVCCENVHKNRIDRHVCTHQERIACEYCEIEFKSTVHLLRHLDTSHINQKIYKCNRCQKLFGMHLLLDIHNQFHNRRDKENANKLKCISCSIVCSSSVHLERHQNFHCKLNGNIEWHLCEMCGSGFNSINKLEQHTRLHKEQKFQCPICFQLLSNTSSLKRHIERHESSTSDEVH